MSKCIICGEKFASSKMGMEAHNKRFHGGISTNEFTPLESRAQALFGASSDGSTGKKGTGKIVPTRLTHRSSEQIRVDFHKMLGESVFPAIRPWDSANDTEGYL